MEHGLDDCLLNIYEWERGDSKLDVMALYDALAKRYGHDTPTNYLAKLVADLADAESWDSAGATTASSNRTLRVTRRRSEPEADPKGSGPFGF